MKDCLFCSIALKRIPAEIVYADVHTTAFLDIHPRAPGHTMVVPNAHAETILDLEAESAGQLFIAVRAVVDRLATALNPDGFTIGINQGKAAGQAVPHLHVHIMPRFAGDRGGSVHTVVNNPSDMSIGEIAIKIRKEMRY